MKDAEYYASLSTIERARCPEHRQYGTGKAFGVELSCCVAARAEALRVQRVSVIDHDAALQLMGGTVETHTRGSSE